MTDRYAVVPLSPMGKVIAQRMGEARRAIPQFSLTVEIQADALVSLRSELLQGEAEARLTLNDLLLKACAQALIEIPAVNVQWAGTEIHQYLTADISIVTALPGGGLATPILRAVEGKSVWEISREVRELVLRASQNRLKMSEIQGGSFSVSNLGMYGVDQFDAIINPPQCAILAVGVAKPRAVVSADGRVSAATTLRATLAADHRAIDGATGGKFLSAFRKRVEDPASLRPEQ